MAATNPQIITGNWSKGIALDVHTLSSVKTGVTEAGRDLFDTTRSELGQLLYRLKYSSDPQAAQDIIDTASAYLQPSISKFNLIVPVPPSAHRAVQPVITVANGIGAKLQLPVSQCITTTRPTEQLKGVTDPDARKALLDGLYAVDASQTTGKHILLFDDLFRSGSTMNAITDVLLKDGRASAVYALTITKTRSNR